jgi:hypothetical protein
MKRFKVMQSERHLRTVIVEGPDDFNEEDAFDCAMLGHDNGGRILDDVTEYQDVMQDAISTETEEETVT